MVVPRSSTPAPSVEIPDKLYFKIGEVADLVGVQTHVLRYWEKEIPAIRPAKSTSNQRRYRRRDVEIFREIHRLLYQERYTLAGARKRLSPGRGGSGSGEAKPIMASQPSPDEPEIVRAAAELSAHGSDSDSAAVVAANTAQLGRVRSGLRELIRMAGEEP